MYRQDVIRAAFFVLFFSVGIASLGISVLCDDLIRHYQNNQLIESAKQTLDKLKLLNNDYDHLLALLENDPNLLKRIAPVTLGAEQQEPNTVYPRVTAEQLAAARAALTDPNEESVEIVIPRWLSRSSEPRKRMALFFSGVALILISFVCFRPAKKAS